MEIQGLQALYAGHKSVKALVKALQDGSARTIFAEGLCASAAEVRAAGRSQRDTPHGGYQPFVGRASSAFRGHLSRGGDGKSRVAAETE